MPHRWMAVLALALSVSGCFRVTIDTGAAHSPTVIERPWQMSFAAGLVPPPEIHTQADCPQGIAQVTTQRSFLNQLAAMATSDVISPIDVRIVCAAGPVSR